MDAHSRVVSIVDDEAARALRAAAGRPERTNDVETASPGPPIPMGGLPRSRLRRVTEFIQEHLDQRVTLAQLGAVANMSPYHFARLFKGSTGVPPHRFVLRKRVERAAALLTAQELAIARIAQVVGFRTASHFTTVFRRFTGITPKAYRATARQAGPHRQDEGHGRP